MSTEETATKRKLTLSVDEEVVKRAKALGLNLSEITESVLRGLAFAPDEAARGSLYGKYLELFNTMVPLLRDYDASVEVAKWYFSEGPDPDEITGEATVYLDANGRLTRYDSDDPDGSGKSITIFDISLSSLPKPKNILAKFITAIAKSKEDRQEQFEELEMAKRIIAAIDATAGKPSRKETSSTRE